MHKRKLLYFHGLHGSLSEEKRAALKTWFEITAPQIDYEMENIDQLVEYLLSAHEFDALIGNSMGGYVAYHTARRFNLPCMIFNPALSTRSIQPNFNPLELNKEHKRLVYAVLGKRDSVVPAAENMTFFMEDVWNKNCIISWHNKLEHIIDIETFRLETERFVRLLDLESPE